MNWQTLDLKNIPPCSGVYGFKNGDRWLYIGRARNLAKRLTSHHPALQIACSLTLPISYWYIPSDTPGKLEGQLLQELEPEWNGGTSREVMSERHLYAAHGVFCNVWLDSREGFLKALAEMAKLHPDRLIYFSEAGQYKILNGIPFFDRTPVSQQEADTALCSLWN
jgi:hypothetical protein